MTGPARGYQRDPGGPFRGLAHLSDGVDQHEVELMARREPLGEEEIP